MNKELLTITKFESIIDGQTYFLYLIPKKEILEFFLGKEGHENLYSMASIDVNRMTEKIDDFININIKEWLEILEDIIEQ